MKDVLATAKVEQRPEAFRVLVGVIEAQLNSCTCGGSPNVYWEQDGYLQVYNFKIVCPFCAKFCAISMSTIDMWERNPTGVLYKSRLQPLVEEWNKRNRKTVWGWDTGDKGKTYSVLTAESLADLQRYAMDYRVIPDANGYYPVPQFDVDAMVDEANKVSAIPTSGVTGEVKRKQYAKAEPQITQLRHRRKFCFD